MKRVLRPEIVTLAGMVVMASLIAVPDRCAAQQAHSPAAVTEKRVVPPPTAPAPSARDAEASADGAQPEAANLGATAKSGSLASRIRTITRYAPLRETQTTVGLGTKYVRGVMGGLDIFGFGDAGQVWEDNRSTTAPAILANQDFNWQVWKTSPGGGLQYRYSKALAGRVEIGHSNQGDRFYFSVSRGF